MCCYDAVVSVQFREQSYIVNSEGMVNVFVMIDKNIAHPLPVMVLVSMSSLNTTAGKLVVFTLRAY